MGKACPSDRLVTEFWMGEYAFLPDLNDCELIHARDRLSPEVYSNQAVVILLHVAYRTS
jgi:hypothetical protein